VKKERAACRVENIGLVLADNKENSAED